MRRRSTASKYERVAQVVFFGGLACLVLGIALVYQSVEGDASGGSIGAVLALFGLVAAPTGGWMLAASAVGDVADSAATAWENRHKRCPDCAERVRAEARVCKHCGHRFAQQSGSESPS